jgi:hypothetical protein
LHQVEDIRAFERVAAGQHEHRPRAKLGQLVDEPQRLLRCQFAWIRRWLGASSAMTANQIAGSSDFIENQQRTLGESAAVRSSSPNDTRINRDSHR